MGLAAILIILCHMPANGVIMPSVLSHVVKYGGLGCDVFLLLSGIGMSSSLSKNVIRGGQSTTLVQETIPSSYDSVPAYMHSIVSRVCHSQ